jgi:adenylate cyclase
MAASGQDRIERRLVAILAADVAGYSWLTGVDEEGTHVQLQAHLRALVDPKVAEHRGRVVKNTGDGMLAEFSSVVDAVRCALDVQRGMAERNAGVPDDKRIEFRMGINVGDIIIDRGDIFGDGVNVAARLEGLAKPGGICISDDAHRQVRGKFDVAFEDVGERQLKSIARPVRVFQVALDDARPAKPISRPHNAASAVRRRWSIRAAAIGAAVLLIASAVGAALYFHLGRVPVPLPDQLAKRSERFSIIVLPFANLSGDASQDHLADIISDELTTGFSRFRNSFVISRSTAFTYKGKPINVRQIGKELGVRYVLEGSVQPSVDRLRVNAQLIDTESDAHLWADRFDEKHSDLLQMQDAIVHRIAFAIGIKLTDERAREAQTRAANPNAEDLAFRCSAALMRTIWGSERDSAFRLCEQALEIDPENVRALSHLSSKFTQRLFLLAASDPQADLRRADELASLAIKIDPGYHAAHAAKGDALLGAGRYRDAIDSYERALMLAPNSILIGLPLAYNRIAEPEQAIAYADKAMRLSPHDPGLAGPMFHFAKALAFSMLQDHEQALVSIERAEVAAPEIVFMGFFRSVLLAIAGQEAEARAAMQRYLANEHAPVRTMSQWHARQSEKPLPSYNPLVLARLLTFRKKLDDGLRKAGLPE